MAENKEQLSYSTSETTKPVVDIIDVNLDSEVTVPREVKTWMQKVEEAGQTPTQTITDENGVRLLTPIAPTNPIVKLPISRPVFTSGFTKSFSQAGRWLSEFVLRLIKINKGNAKFLEK